MALSGGDRFRREKRKGVTEWVIGALLAVLRPRKTGEVGGQPSGPRFVIANPSRRLVKIRFAEIMMAVTAGERAQI